MSEPTDSSPVEAHECSDVKCPYCADTFCAGCDQCLATALAEVAALRAENGKLREAIRELLEDELSEASMVRARAALSSGADGGQEGKA